MAKNLYFNKEHLWIKIEGKRGTIGITPHAQEELGDILLVELPDLQTEIEQGSSFGQIESAKAVSDLICPVSGTIVEVNEILDEEPEVINEDPLGKGWIMKMTLSDTSELDELLNEEEYEQYLEEELE